MKIRKMKAIIITISLSLVVFLCASVKTFAYSSNQAYIHQDIRSINFTKQYYNIYFEQNNYGVAGLVRNQEEMLFWSDIIERFNNSYDNRILRGAEFIIHVQLDNQNYTYTIGFTYQEGMGAYNNYIGGDLAVILGTQICDVQTGFKTYTTLKNDNITSFKVLALEIYTKTENITTGQAEATQHGIMNQSSNTFTADNKILFNALASLKGLSALELAPSLNDIYNEGYNEGYEIGNIEGSEEGTQRGYDYGYSVGFAEGKEEGKANSGFGITTLLSSIMSAFFAAFWTMGSFELFGIKLWNIPVIVGGIGLIWLVIKFFFGK